MAHLRVEKRAELTADHLAAKKAEQKVVQMAH